LWQSFFCHKSITKVTLAFELWKCFLLLPRQIFYFMRLSHLLCVLSLLVCSTVRAQVNYSWWNTLHHWDGYSQWSSYIVTNPGHLGPNALPVPMVRTARVGTEVQLELTGEHHVQSGDITTNPYLRLNFPIVRDKVALLLYGVPMEWYKTTIEMRDYRASRGIDPEGHNPGDLYIGTIIQLLKEKGYQPDLTLGATTKTTTGKALENARHTNAPGYYYDLNIGYTLMHDKPQLDRLRAYGIIGLYVWQAYQDRQNDAVFYGLRSDYEFQHWVASGSLAGYKGFFGNGDKPLVTRFSIQYKTRKINWQAEYEYGIRDQATHTFRAGIVLHWEKHDRP
jgi:hypothetical protein